MPSRKFLGKALAGSLQRSRCKLADRNGLHRRSNRSRTVAAAHTSPARHNPETKARVALVVQTGSALLPGHKALCQPYPAGWLIYA
ncbi:hypothetical protein L209DRAFT_750977 [Thermothelomyces heterothallicus CBS 203.75]